MGNFFSDLACFVLANDLFVLLPGTENFFPTIGKKKIRSVLVPGGFS